MLNAFRICQKQTVDSWLLGLFWSYLHYLRKMANYAFAFCLRLIVTDAEVVLVHYGTCTLITLHFKGNMIKTFNYVEIGQVDRGSESWSTWCYDIIPASSRVWKDKYTTTSTKVEVTMPITGLRSIQVDH